MPGITLLGLGPGDPGKLTKEAWNVLLSAKEIWLRTDQHPTVKYIPDSVKINSFDSLYDTSDSFEKVYQKIVSRILNLGNRQMGVIYAVPGDPFVAEATCPEIAMRARSKGLSVVTISGVSFLEPVFSAINLDPFPRISMIDAMGLSKKLVADFQPDIPALIAQLYSRMVAAEVKMTLTSVYPDDHPVQLVHSAGTRDEIIENIRLFEIDRSKHIGLLTVLFLPPLEQGSSFESFQEIIARLRAPDGCPWDKEQTHQTLRAHLLEECYEVVEAIDEKNPEKMVEELGDLLLQIVLHAQIASETGDFSINDVIRTIHQKIIRRHPHVFGNETITDVAGVLNNWEKIKDVERQTKGKLERGILDGVPLALPALVQAQEYQDRAARVGFDWPEISGVVDKIQEEITELKDARGDTEFASEMGDLLFALVNLARWNDLDAESVLRQANKKFKRRFAFIEAQSKGRKKKLSDMTLEEMDFFWQQAKKKGRG